MNPFFTAVMVLGLVASSYAGDITGIVRAKGKIDDNDLGIGPNYQSHKFKFAERVNYDALTDFIVFIDGKIPGVKPPTEHSRVVTQKDATFKPHVLPVMAGTVVEWPNEDEIYHNVFSKSDVKPFDLQLYKKGDAGKNVLFEKPGQVDVFCSIHARMTCIVLVLDNPYFSPSNEKNRYTIKNVPPGKYKLTAWHERLPSLTQEITVPETGVVNMDFLMGIKNLPKY
jgi:plastocyanin